MLYYHGNFHQFHHLLSLVKFYHANFLSSINDCIEDMATFSCHIGEIYSTNGFCNTKVAGLSEVLIQRKFPRIRYFVLLYTEATSTLCGH